jgi:putative ABC transport system substrate-binding protein
MRRREFIAGLGGAAAWPLVARAQQPAMPVIGLLSSGPFGSNFAAFRRGLAETGHVEGQNVVFEYRTAENHFDRLPALAEDLVRRRVAAIFTAVNVNPALAANAASRGNQRYSWIKNQRSWFLSWTRPCSVRVKTIN